MEDIDWTTAKFEDKKEIKEKLEKELMEISGVLSAEISKNGILVYVVRETQSRKDRIWETFERFAPDLPFRIKSLR